MTNLIHTNNIKNINSLTQVAKIKENEIQQVIDNINNKKAKLEKELNQLDHRIFSTLPKIFLIGREVLKYQNKRKTIWTYVDFITIETSFWQLGKRVIKFKWNNCDRCYHSSELVECYKEKSCYDNKLNYLDLDSLKTLEYKLDKFEEFLIENIQKH